MDEKAPKIIKDLVERFERNITDYKTQGYKEDHLRQEFINYFFEALGWDVGNKSGAAPAYRDVIHEDSIKMTGGGTKAPDYCFTLSGTKKFFVETKKPSVDIKKDPHPAYQLRRYAWSAELPVSILTNFEEFSVYESRRKPKEDDKVDTELLKRFNYKEYVEKWSEISSIFSKSAILQGSFDKFLESAKQKRGTQEVGDEFLKEIENWRDLLARNIAVRNPQLSSVRELNYAVQSTIDRIIFLRMCEDRGIEQYGQLQALLKNENIYKNLCKIYEKADEKYNSGLFHFTQERGRSTPPDEITLKMIIDDKVLGDIIKNIYYPDSPYEFSVLRSEILGNVYEQFLGKVIRLTEGHHAKVEEKPEVKKAGGVFYTPEYIVDYIVKNTVGRLCEGKTPKQLEKLRVLDPACGSGSFLLGAYTYLLKYHLDSYIKRKNPRLYKNQIFQGKDGQWFLTVKEKKRILLNNIYGVDIDSQAVEVTKLSLLLKVLEGAERDIFEKQQKLWTERVLPDLGNNIKCGNSLIGPDFYDTDQKKLVDDNEGMYRINAFDWDSEFKEIMQRGGFDAIIGNPPYVRQETLGNLKEYFQQHYQVYHGIADLYAYFIERGVSLLKENGIFSYIVANKWMRANYGAPLRTWMKQQIDEIVDFGDLPIFQEATTYPCIIRISRGQKRSIINVTQVKTLDFSDLQDYVKKEHYAINRTDLDTSGWSLTNKKIQEILKKLKTTGEPLGKFVQKKIYYGIKTGLNEAFVIDEQTRDKILSQHPRSKELIKPFLLGRDIKRYGAPKTNHYLILIPKEWTSLHSGKSSDKWAWLKQNHPSIADHLAPFEKDAEKRCDKGEYWWELRSCDYYNEFEKPKIMLPDISIRGNFTLDDEGGVYCVNTAYIISNADKYLLGILNSLLMTFYYENLSSRYRGDYLRYIYQYMIQLPIRGINFSDQKDKSLHDKMVDLVNQMLDFHKRLTKAKAENEKVIIQRQIDATDKQIDQLVYELYGLTKKEIAIVEGNK